VQHHLDPALLRLVACSVLDYLFDGRGRSVDSEDGDKLVEYGIARFSTKNRVIIDEPLAFIAVIDSFIKSEPKTVQRFLIEAVSMQNGGTSLAKLGAYLLTLAFGDSRPLSEVFNFVGDTPLKDEGAELVAIDQGAGAVSSDPINIFSEIPPFYRLGFTSSSPKDDLHWMRNPRKHVFCTPSRTLGPDLIFVLKLDDGKHIRVLVHFTTGRGGTEDALRSTDPQHFLVECNKESKSSGSTRSGSAAKGENLVSFMQLFPFMTHLRVGYRGT
jgi:hypothetical protein